MELPSFILVSLTSVYLTSQKRSQAKHQRVGIFFLLLTYLAISRVDPEGDINTYYDAMQSWNFSLYYAVEPVIWFGQQSVYAFLGSQRITFLIFDAIFLLLLNQIRSKADLSNYFLVAAFLSLPLFLGHQNVYRQLFSMIFITLSILSLKEFETVQEIIFSMAFGPITSEFI